MLSPQEMDERDHRIKAEYAAGIGYGTIGKRYGISATRVKDIIYPELRRVLTVRPYKTTIERRRRKVPNLPIMNGGGADDFLRLLKEANLSQKRFARYMGYSEVSVNNYASGKTPFPLHVRRYLELLVFVRKKVKMVRSLRLEDVDKYD